MTVFFLKCGISFDMYLDGLIRSAVEMFFGCDQRPDPVIQPRNVLLFALQLHCLQIPNLQKNYKTIFFREETGNKLRK